VRESWAELKKVDWPNRNQTVQGTIVVIIACAVVGAYLWGLDQILQPFVRDVLLGG
jgi:preprotein translocase subunit SecE